MYTGITTIFLITYIAEITVDDQRRVLSGAYGFCIRIGLFIAYLAGVWLPFRWLAALGLIQISIFCFLFILNPLSPVWYIRQGLDEKARKILIYLHGSDFDSDTQIQKLKTESINDTPNWIESFKSLKEWKVLKPTILMVIVASLKSLGGHEAMVSFSSHILENQQAMDPKLASLFYPIFLIAGAIVCIFLLNSCKQKWLLIVSSLLLACSHISMAAYYYVSDNYLHCKLLPSQICLSLSFWPIFNIALFAFSYSLGWGLVYFSLLGVMFTVHREFSTAITEMINNLASYLVVMNHKLGNCIVIKLVVDLEYFELQKVNKLRAFKIRKTYIMASFHMRTFKIIYRKLLVSYFLLLFLFSKLSDVSLNGA